MIDPSTVAEELTEANPAWNIASVTVVSDDEEGDVRLEVECNSEHADDLIVQIVTGASYDSEQITKIINSLPELT